MELQLSDISNRDTQALEVLQNIDDLSQDRSADRVPRVDGGKDAWLFLAASFVIEGLIWGKSIRRYIICSAIHVF